VARSGWQAVGRGGLLLCGGLLGALCLTEALFRTFVMQPKVPRTEAAFAAQVASRWPAPVALAKRPGTIRMIGLCDSFGEAGEHRNYHYLMADQLRAQGWQVEMVNLSVGEYDLPEEQLALSRWAARYQPDLVLHGFYCGNDFYLTGHGELMTYQGISVRRRSFLTHPSPKSFMFLVWTRNWLRGTLATRAEQTQRVDEGPGTFGVADFLRIERDRFEHCALQPPVDQRWTEVAQRLDTLVATTRAMGARYAMVIHPDQYQVEPALRERVIQTYGLNPADYDWEQPQTWLQAWAARAGVPAIDLLPAFRAKGAAEGLFRPRDTHYAEAGNAVAAEVLAEELPQRVPEVFSGRAHRSWAR